MSLQRRDQICLVGMSSLARVVRVELGVGVWAPWSRCRQVCGAGVNGIGGCLHWASIPEEDVPKVVEE